MLSRWTWRIILTDGYRFPSAPEDDRRATRRVIGGIAFATLLCRRTASSGASRGTLSTGEPKTQRTARCVVSPAGEELYELMLGYLIDMDGVIYRGGHLIAGADRFINELRKSDVPFRFLTNNSQRTRRDVATRLQRLGLDVEPEHVYTCATATARFLAQQMPGGTAYVIGEGGLLTALHENGYAIVDKDPDYVVVGEGRTISFEMVEAALKMILGGANLVATNLDPNCPTESGLRPGCGATVAMLETASGVKAFSVGKPSPVMLRGARKELGLSTDQTVVIGDTMETDILGGVQLGFKTILVLSGGTDREDLARFAYRPDKIVDSIADLEHGDLFREFTGSSASPRGRKNGSLPRETALVTTSK
jgi:NagD protein